MYSENHFFEYSILICFTQLARRKRKLKIKWSKTVVLRTVNGIHFVKQRPHILLLSTTALYENKNPHGIGEINYGSKMNYKPAGNLLMWIALNTVGTTKIGKVGHQFKDMCNRWIWRQTLMTYFTLLYLLNPKGGLAWSHSFLIGCLCISYKGLEGCNCNFPQTKIHHFLLVENAIFHWSTKRSGMWPHEFTFYVLQLTDSWLIHACWQNQLSSLPWVCSLPISIIILM